MRTASQAYADAIVGASRRIVPYMYIDLLDPDVEIGAPSASNQNAYSRISQVVNRETTGGRRYSDLELNAWLLDGSADFLPADPADQVGQQGWRSEVICGNDGTFAVPPELRLGLSGCDVLQVLTVAFPDDPLVGRPTSVRVNVYSGSSTVYTGTYTVDQPVMELGGFTAYAVTAIGVEVLSWSVPGRRARILSLRPGIFRAYDDDRIVNVDIVDEVSFSGTSYPYGTCSVEIDNSDLELDPMNRNSLFTSLEERLGIDVAMGVTLPGGNVEQLKLGRYFFQQNGWQLGSNHLTFKLQLVDIRGLLAKRTYHAPANLPATVSGWLESIVSLLGDDWSTFYGCDSSLADLAITATTEDVDGKTAGELLRMIAMAAGGYIHTDPETGELRLDPIPETGGSEISLDNQTALPGVSANGDLADITFTVGEQQYTIGGNASASGTSLIVQNPFIHTQQQAMQAARNILIHYGGNKIAVKGRGDMRTQPGDVDTVELESGQLVAARRYKQQLKVAGGVMSGVPSYLLQGSGLSLYENVMTITTAGTWTAPAGCTSIDLVLVGGGSGGTAGTSGDWTSGGEPGQGGQGGKILAISNVPVTPGSAYSCTVGTGGAQGADGTASTFGIYSSADGEIYDAYCDLRTFRTYGQRGNDGSTAVYNVNGLAGSSNTGNGGTGGAGGAAGLKGTNRETGEEVIKRYPHAGGRGGRGGTGCIVISFDKN